MPPGGGELLGASFLHAVPSAPELVGQLHHGAEEGGAVVVQQFGEASLLDEAAEFDELACACAAFLNPNRRCRAWLGRARRGFA